MTHRMRVRDLGLRVRLGCTKEERAMPQEVRVSVELAFTNPPEGARSDDLRDTVCYARLSEAMRSHAESREYLLVEKLAADLHGVASQLIEGRARFTVLVHKVRPPVAGLDGGVEYSIGDLD